MRLGPFFDEKLLRGTLEELVTRIPLITIYFIEFFEMPSDINFFNLTNQFYKQKDQWNAKYRKIPTVMKDF